MSKNIRYEVWDRENSPTDKHRQYRRQKKTWKDNWKMPTSAVTFGTLKTFRGDQVARDKAVL